MRKFMKTGLNLFMYGLLGLVLSMAGVSVIDQPMAFIAIMLIVVLIDAS